MWSLFRRNSRQAKPARRVLSSFRPRLEALEDRCLMSAGALDPTFGNGAGYVTTSLTNYTDKADSVLVEPNGTIIEAGMADAPTNGSVWPHISLTAYNPDGTLDSAFGNGGTVVGPVGVSADAVLYPSTDPNGNGGKLIVTGFENTPTVSSKEFGIVRYNANGTLDTTFGNGGIAIANFGSTLGTQSSASAVIQPDGKVVALGESANESTAELARFKADGSLDTSFGNGGLATIQVPAAEALLLQPDGSLVVIGLGQPAQGLVMAELHANGTLNTSFGSSGTGYVTNSSFHYAAGINGCLGAIDPTGQTTDDQIVVIGNPASGGGFQLARYNPQGTLDTTFGNGGTVTTGITGSHSAVAVQADGKIVASGTDTGLGLIRYNADGSLDTTFGSGGIVATKIGVQSSPSANGLTFDSNGNIVVAFSSYTGSKWNFGVARYLSTAIAEPSQPQIGSFKASPNPVKAGRSFTLTASSLSDSNPGSTITQVIFYFVSGNAGTLNTSADSILGFATQTSPGVWQLTSSFGTKGTYTLFAQAEDNFGVYSTAVALTLTVD